MIDVGRSVSILHRQNGTNRLMLVLSVGSSIVFRKYRIKFFVGSGIVFAGALSDLNIAEVYVGFTTRYVG